MQKPKIKAPKIRVVTLPESIRSFTGTMVKDRRYYIEVSWEKFYDSTI
jgi:hypothetical protein